jgi:thiol-disulfide isomerase/thioredoxin
MISRITKISEKHCPWIAVLLLCLQVSSLEAAEEILVASHDDVEISVTRYAADGDYLVIWLAPEYGFRKAHRVLAEKLAAQGIEVWQSDLVESLFMPPGSASLKRLDGRHIANLIEYAHSTTGRKIAIAGDSYAAMLALRGAHQWQQRPAHTDYLVGAILFSPYSYASIPPLGTAPEYLPIVESTNIPLMIYQAQKNGIVSQFDTLLEKLRQHGNPVFTSMVPDVMSLFYQEEPTAAMQHAAQPLAHSIGQILPLLARQDFPLQPIAFVPGGSTASGIDVHLKEFQGQRQPGAINLHDIHGNAVVRTSFSGQVTVVNFWATWCPPCIEEIPSLNRLQALMQGHPFEIISINYAQDKSTVLDFLQRIDVNFPVLLDPAGDYAKSWKVISFPSTFVIDKQGDIRYGVNAAIAWDSPQLIDKLSALLN